MVLIGSADTSEFSWIEYQALMLCLAGIICASLFFVEIGLSRFQVLPLLYPGMFTVRERRFFFFNFDISDGVIGKSVRAEAKMVVRITMCLCTSYLWQHCVLETNQQVGMGFPADECAKGADCFASRMHFTTLFNREHERIDCKAGEEGFSHEDRMVVSCIRFIPPTATTWLMHLAISHSVTQLNFKAFELMVWIGGNSRWFRRLLGCLIFVSLASLVGLFFSGLIAEFVSSWLSFTMSLSIPMFLFAVFKNAKRLAQLWDMDAIQVQQHIEEHLSGAFADIEDAVNLEATADKSTNEETDGEPIDPAASKHSDFSKRSQAKEVMSSIRSAISKTVSIRRKSKDGAVSPRSAFWPRAAPPQPLALAGTPGDSPPQLAVQATPETSEAHGTWFGEPAPVQRPERLADDSQTRQGKKGRKRNAGGSYSAAASDVKLRL